MNSKKELIYIFSVRFPIGPGVDFYFFATNEFAEKSPDLPAEVERAWEASRAKSLVGLFLSGTDFTDLNGRLSEMVLFTGPKNRVGHYILSPKHGLDGKEYRSSDFCAAYGTYVLGTTSNN